VDSNHLVGLRTKATVPACAIQFVTAVALFFRYGTKRKRSHLLELYLLLVAVLDSFRVHTLWSRIPDLPYNPTALVVPALQTVATGLYAVFLTVISRQTPCSLGGGQSNRLDTESLVPRESEVCLISLLFLGWLNQLLYRGKRLEITERDMEKLEIHPASVFSISSERRLCLATRQTLWAQMIQDIPLRTHLTYVGALILNILLATAILCQPLIIRGLVQFLQSYQHPSVGAWFVVALILE
jgi:hypothetical protein